MQTLGAFRTLSRMVKDAARVETPFLRVCFARYGYLLKYNMPVSEGPLAPANAANSPRKQENSGVQPKKASSADKKPGRPA